MKFTIESQGIYSYLVYTVAPDDEIDSMSLGMLTNNKIDGLAPATFMQMDETKYIKYNVSSKVSVRQFFEGQVNRKRLLGVFNGIVDAMLSAEEYMIDIHTIILDLDCMFTDVSTCKTELVCLPLLNCSSSVELVPFFKNILFSTQYDETENCDYVTAIINYINRSNSLSLSDFKMLLNSLKGNGAAERKKTVRSVAEPEIQLVQQSISQPVSQPMPHPTPQPTPQPIPRPVSQPDGSSMQSSNNRSGMGVKQPVQPIRDEEDEQDEADNISLFYLLCHYSKENVEKYKRKKEADKGKNIKNGSKDNSDGSVKNSKDKNEKQFVNDFAIPGQGPTPIIAQNEWNDRPQAPMDYNPARQDAAGHDQIRQDSIKQHSYAQESFGQNLFGRNDVQYGSINDNYAHQDYSEAAMVQPDQSYSSNSGDTRPLGPADATISTGDDAGAALGSAVSPYLIYKKNGNKILINKDVFRIGREVNYVDYCIQNNRAIGRSHAFIKSQNGKYYVVDTNSLNHTYVNGVEIKPQTETEITHGTELRFANENFEFRLY